MSALPQPPAPPRAPSIAPPIAPSIGPRSDTPDAALDRYARQVLLPEVGVMGQRRLAAAKVLVVGAGGLGSPALLYLAAAGVGTLGVIDDDLVDLTNLHRQVLHGEASVGRPKTESAQEAIARLDSRVRVVRHDTRLTRDSAPGIIRGYDLVVDGSDNFDTRYAVGRACAQAGLPHVWASVLQFQAQISVWWVGRGPCYRCVFPASPPPGSVASCVEAGVLGSLTGTIGSLQATEALKILLGVGDPLVGRLLLHDALAQTWETLPVRRRVGCPDCDPSAQAGEDSSTRPDLVTVTPHWLAGIGSDQRVRVVDVRDAAEREALPGPAAHGIPLASLRDGTALQSTRLGSPEDTLVFVCRSGVRSEEARALAQAAGWRYAVSLEGGALAWSRWVAAPTSPAGSSGAVESSA